MTLDRTQTSLIKKFEAYKLRAAELREKWKKSIKMVDALYEGYFKNEVVAYHPDGTPMTRQDYKMVLDVAESQIKKGDFMTAEEFEKEEN